MVIQTIIKTLKQTDFQEILFWMLASAAIALIIVGSKYSGDIKRSNLIRSEVCVVVEVLDR